MLGARAKAKKEENLSLFERRRREIGDSDINVESFDIAGMMLGMTPSDIMEVATLTVYGPVAVAYKTEFKQLCKK